MNRHLINYSALPTDALGPPMRAEPTKPADGAWKPLRPGYEVRTLAGGAQEVRCTALPTQPPKQQKQAGVESVMHGLAEASAAPVEWQSGAPPEKGWRLVRPTALGNRGDRFAYWFGDGWSLFGPKDAVSRSDIEGGPVHGADSLQWRGPRLTGADWPEPETPQ
jgi:hypothetical protein